MNHSCTSAPGCASRAVASRTGSSFFERLGSAWVVLRVHGPCLLVRQIQFLAQDAAHALLAVVHAKALFTEGDCVHDPPGRDAVALRLGSPQPGLPRQAGPLSPPDAAPGLGCLCGVPGASVRRARSPPGSPIPPSPCLPQHHDEEGITPVPAAKAKSSHLKPGLVSA